MIFVDYIKRKRAERKAKKKKNSEEKLYKTYGQVLYPQESILSVLTIYLEEIGVRTFDYDSHYMNIIFKDGTQAQIWNANRWECWMSSGDVQFSNGERLHWGSKMPPIETLYKYRKYVENYENDITKYLPISYQRKKKLDKLNEEDNK